MLLIDFLDSSTWHSEGDFNTPPGEVIQRSNLRYAVLESNTNIRPIWETLRSSPRSTGLTITYTKVWHFLSNTECRPRVNFPPTFQKFTTCIWTRRRMYGPWTSVQTVVVISSYPLNTAYLIYVSRMEVKTTNRNIKTNPQLLICQLSL